MNQPESFLSGLSSTPSAKRKHNKAGDADLTKDKGVVKVACGDCGYVVLFNAETVGIRAMWDEQRGF